MSGVKNDLRNHTLCKCPKCGKKFKRWTTYTGRLPAYLYCSKHVQSKTKTSAAYATDFETTKHGGNK